MQKILLVLALAASPAFAAHANDGEGRERSCRNPLDGENFLPDGTDRARAAAYAVRVAHPDYGFDSLDSGRWGLRLYLIPHAHAARIFELAAASFYGGSKRVREGYDPRESMVLALLETHASPMLSLMLLRKNGIYVPLMTMKTVFSDLDQSERLKRLVPSAWDGRGDFHPAHPLWAMLDGAEEIPLPRVRNYPDWSLDHLK